MVLYLFKIKSLFKLLFIKTIMNLYFIIGNAQVLDVAQLNDFTKLTGTDNVSIETTGTDNVITTSPMLVSSIIKSNVSPMLDVAQLNVSTKSTGTDNVITTSPMLVSSTIKSNISPILPSTRRKFAQQNPIITSAAQNSIVTNKTNAANVIAASEKKQTEEEQVLENAKKRYESIRKEFIGKKEAINKNAIEKDSYGKKDVNEKRKIIKKAIPTRE